MKLLTTTLLALVFLGSTTFGQTKTSNRTILKYQKVIELTLDKNTQNYVTKDTINFSGMISIDSLKIFIKGYNNQPDKTLKIIEFEKKNNTKTDRYICEMNDEKYHTSISPDKKYLTLIGTNNKFIYELKENDDEIHVIPIKKEESSSKSNQVFTAQSLDEKPIFGNANSFEEGEKKLKEYLSTEIKKYTTLKPGTCYLSIVINKKGKVENVKILYGKDEEFNKAALEIVKNMPDWKPGKQNGKLVNAAYNLAVRK